MQINIENNNCENGSGKIRQGYDVYAHQSQAIPLHHFTIYS